MGGSPQSLSSQDIQDLQEISSRLPQGHPMIAKISTLLNSKMPDDGPWAKYAKTDSSSDGPWAKYASTKTTQEWDEHGNPVKQQKQAWDEKGNLIPSGAKTTEAEQAAQAPDAAAQAHSATVNAPMEENYSAHALTGPLEANPGVAKSLAPNPRRRARHFAPIACLLPAGAGRVAKERLRAPSRGYS